MTLRDDGLITTGGDPMRFLIGGFVAALLLAGAVASANIGVGQGLSLLTMPAGIGQALSDL